MIRPDLRPTGVADRIASLDVLRGFALPGILVMNIQVFSMPAAAYDNPSAFGDLSGWNFVAWALARSFADQKFITLFSMLFGAGVCLFADRIEARGDRPAGVHYRRMFWLLVFGLFHAYLLWYGDILVPYAICGCFVVLARRWRPRALLLAGFALFAFGSAVPLLAGAALASPAVPDAARAEVEREWSPGPDAIAAEVAAYRGGFAEQLPVRAAQATRIHLFLLPFFIAWPVSGAMLIGMGLYRLGVLNAARRDRFYGRLATFGLLLGAPLVLYGVWWDVAGDFRWERSLFVGAQFNAWGSLGVALGYLGLVMLAVRRRFLPGLQARLAAAGRMAFTNYLFQTVVCTAIFYGHGLGLFGSVDRVAQLLIALGVGLLQLWLSPIWLRSFAWGPLEWAWRVLTYGRMPRLRSRAAFPARPSRSLTK